MSATKTFLLELHCEEIPARFLKPLTEDFGEGLRRLGPTEPRPAPPRSVRRSVSTPRASSPGACDGLPAAQPDQTETQVGPPQRMCVDEDGQPTDQGLKFAEKWGVDFSAVRFEQPAGKKEPCAVVTLTKQGRPTVELLAEALPGLIAGLHVPKAMRWGNTRVRVRAAHPQHPVPLRRGGGALRGGWREAARTTWGHRLHHHAAPGARAASPRREAYEQALEAGGHRGVLRPAPDAHRQQLKTLAAEVGGRVVEDAELLDTLAEIVEFPASCAASSPPDFMALPKEVLVTSLKEHQKSFCIEDARRRAAALLPHRRQPPG